VFESIIICNHYKYSNYKQQNSCTDAKSIASLELDHTCTQNCRIPASSPNLSLTLYLSDAVVAD
jgi:hypothetical protein